MAFGAPTGVTLPDDDLAALYAVQPRPRIFFRPGPRKRPKMPPGSTVRVNPTTGKPEVVAGAGGPATGNLTPAQQIAAGILDPQIAAYNRAAEQAERVAAARAEASKGIIGAVYSGTAGLPEAVRAAYQTAADDTSGYAGALSGELRSTAGSAAAEAAQMIASLHAPGEVGSQADALASTGQYLGGFLPARDLAAEAASRLTETGELRAAAGASLGQQALAQQTEERAAADELRAKGLDLELSRPGEIQKAMEQLRAQGIDERQIAVQERALQVQIGQLQLSQAKTLWDQAEAQTNMTGVLHVVRNGRIVNTGRKASGSDAAQMLASARASATSAKNTRLDDMRDRASDLTDQTGKLHVVRNGKIVNTGRRAPGSKAATSSASARATASNRKVSQGLSQANLQLSRERLKLAQQREARLSKGSSSGGFTPKQKQDFRSTARLAVAYVLDKDLHPVEALRLALNKGVPFSIAIGVLQNAARTNADLKGDPYWQAVLGWTKKR